MAPASGSLTSTGSLFRADALSADNYLRSNSATLSHSSTLHLLSTKKSSTLTNRSFGLPSANLPTARFISYSSSQDEAQEQVRLLDKRKTTRKKQEAKKYKSAEFLDCESDGPDADTSDHQQRSRTRSPKILKQTSQTKNSTALAISGKMVRMDSLTWGASVSRPSCDTRKRPLPPPAPPTNAKRPKLGPFVIDSGSESDSYSDTDDGFSFDSHITMTPRLTERSTRSGMQFPYDEGNSIIPPRASLKRQDSDRAPESQLSTPNTTTTSQSGKSLNKDRLKMLMAKKQGGVVAQSSTQEAPLSMARTGGDLRSRLMNDAHASTLSQKQSAVATAQDDVFASTGVHQNTTSSAQRGTSQQDVRSPTSRGTPPGPKGSRPVQTAQDRTPNASPRLAGRPLNEADESSDAHRSHPQKPSFSYVTTTQARTQQTPASRTFNSSTSWKAKTARSDNVANCSSLCNILDTAKAEHLGAAKEQDNISSGWWTAQAERASTKPIKNVHRPEVGASYGHTLKIRKTNGLEKEPASMRGAPAASGAEDFQASVSGSQTPAPTVPSASPRTQVQVNASRSELTSKASRPVDQASPNARHNTISDAVNQKTLPAASRNKLNQAPTTSGKQSNNAHLSNNVDDRKPQTPSLSSKPTTSSPNTEVATQEPIVPSQSKSTASHNARPQSSVGLSRKGVVTHRKVQTYRTSHAMNMSSPGPNVSDVAQKDASRSVQEATTRSDSLTGTASAQDLVSKESSKATAAQCEHIHGPPTAPVVPSRSMASAATEAMHICHERSTNHALDAPGQRSAYVQVCARTEIPVAVMVCPERQLDAQPYATGGASEVRSAVTEGLNIQSDQTATLPDVSERLQPLTGEFDIHANTLPATMIPLAPAGVTEGTASDVPEPMDLNIDCPDFPVPEELAQVSPSEPANDVALEQRSTESSELVETAPSKSVNSVHEDSTPSAPSPLRVSQFVPTPPKPLTPFSSEEFSQLKTTTGASSPQIFPTSNTCTDPKATLTVLPISTASTQPSNLTHSTEIKLPSPTISPTAEPYFEYTIHQTISFSSSSNFTTEISAHPLTSLDNANAQTNRLFRDARQQHEILGMQCKSTTTQIDKYGLAACEGTFEGTEDPSKSLTLKLWVERAEVGVHENLTPSAISTSPFISRTVYALRLWKLINAGSSEESESESEAEDKDEDDDADIEKIGKEQIRIYHPLPNVCTEVYTSLDAANRAAKRVQIKLSHEKEPRAMQKQWQTHNLHELNGKIEKLRKELNGEGGDDENGSPSLFEYEEGRRKGCWRSMFNGSGLGADRFELLVLRVALSGPRNL
ncbi:hypothetical protein BU25DRAFT_493415 [Macroventuria anomochaeta]|uniref:Uncharacterized protein n=1 Tax=Macroventuria anomochaeta TaxID=301207 RepID=A0ACB6RV62_9PLEO|nr:uncharacterized protein BU25DRAFT_493415 [Macroventuria anomochaeta]KAF2624772.1 hypothetical protein BU25DRAFT_493415 [Macroventuria anomochaeta]